MMWNLRDTVVIQAFLALTDREIHTTYHCVVANECNWLWRIGLTARIVNPINEVLDNPDLMAHYIRHRALRSQYSMILGLISLDVEETMLGKYASREIAAQIKWPVTEG